MGMTNGQPTFNPVPYGKTRLELKAARDTAYDDAEDHWRRQVRERDCYHCRWCKRRVVVTIELIPERAECNHLVGRADERVRWDVRNGILLCLACHQRVTGKVAEKFLIVASELYVVDGIEYPNGSKDVEFKRVA